MINVKFSKQIFIFLNINILIFIQSEKVFQNKNFIKIIYHLCYLKK